MQCRAHFGVSDIFRMYLVRSMRIVTRFSYLKEIFMARKKKAKNSEEAAVATEDAAPVEEQAEAHEIAVEDSPAEQAATEESAAPQQAQIRLNVQDGDMETSYANAFRTNATVEEVLVDFGVNTVTQPATPGGTGEIRYDADHRAILNYFTAKRLAITLGQIVQRHEQQFGELKLNVADRAQR